MSTHKIIFTDIDGTLLDHERQLSPLTKEVFRQLQKEVPVILISSRMPQAMRHLQKELHIEHQPLICYNGGLILVEGEEVFSEEIPFAILEDLVDFNKNTQAHISFYHAEEWYVPQYDFWAKREENNTQVTPVVRPSHEVINNWKSQDKSAHKLMCMGEPEKIDQVFNYLSNQFNQQLHLYRSKDTYLEIASKRISKLTAINSLLTNHFSLKLEDAIAFGDNYNDYEMLKSVGLGIAVGNAKPEILEIAKEVTYHGKEDGVAKSLQKLFNLKKT